MKRRKDMTTPDVVASVARQSEQAAVLAQIAGQDRLADPRMNPATRPHADRLRDGRQIKALEAADARESRRLRVADKRAAHAEQTLQVLQVAKRMSSPARSVMALHTGRTRFLGLALTASVVLSAGSATGPGDLAHKYAGHAFVGWIAEMGLTGLSTMAIMYRSHLGEHGGAGQLKTPGGKLSGKAKVLWLLTLVPLAASIVANAVSHGVIGVFCSIGAAAFGLFAHIISDASSAALQARAGQVTGADEAGLHAAAMGNDPFTAAHAAHAGQEQGAGPEGIAPGPQMLATKAELQAAVLEDLFAVAASEDAPGADPVRPELFTDEALAVWLNEPPEEGGAPSPVLLVPGPGTGGPNGAVRGLPSPAGEAMRPGGHIDRDRAGAPPAAQAGPGGHDPGAHWAARRAAGEQTRARIAAHLSAHPGQTAAQIAAALGVSRETVKRHRRELRREAE